MGRSSGRVWRAVVMGLAALLTSAAPAAGAGAAPSAEPELVTTLLPLLEDSGPRAYGSAGPINNRGVVVGSSGPWPTLWRHGEVVPLTETEPPSGGSGSAINDRGEVIVTEVGGPLRRWYRGRVTELDLGPDSHRWQLAGFNEQGQALVLSWPGLGADFGIWEPDGSFTRIDPPAGHTAVPVDLSDAGHVVGNFGPAGQSHSRPFLWHEGEWTVLAESGVAKAVNRRGQVAGIVGSDLRSLQAVIWDGGEEVPLVTVPGATSIVEDINDRGQVIGLWGTSTEEHAYLWDDGEVTDLGEVAGRALRPQRINERGQVIGIFTEDGLTFRAFLWDGGRMTDLGRGSVAWGLNDRGQVAGRLHTGDGERPAVWQVRRRR